MIDSVLSSGVIVRGGRRPAERLVCARISGRWEFRRQSNRRNRRGKYRGGAPARNEFPSAAWGVEAGSITAPGIVRPVHLRLLAMLQGSHVGDWFHVAAVVLFVLARDLRADDAAGSDSQHTVRYARPSQRARRNGRSEGDRQHNRLTQGHAPCWLTQPGLPQAAVPITASWDSATPAIRRIVSK